MIKSFTCLFVGPTHAWYMRLVVWVMGEERCGFAYHLLNYWLFRASNEVIFSGVIFKTTTLWFERGPTKDIDRHITNVAFAFVYTRHELAQAVTYIVRRYLWSLVSGLKLMTFQLAETIMTFVSKVICVVHPALMKDVAWSFQLYLIEGWMDRKGIASLLRKIRHVYITVSFLCGQLTKLDACNA